MMVQQPSAMADALGYRAAVGKQDCGGSIIAANRGKNDPLCGRRTAHQARLEACRSVYDT